VCESGRSALSRKFWVHAKGDFVGVAVEDIDADQETTGAYMAAGGEIRVKSRSKIPLGHKIALRDIRKGEKVIEYGEVIGVATKGIVRGDHVHTQNLKTLRWT
jgi:(2R)-sulfolactate sulfo-lyase subunit alpha